jgi:hypothetical protein
VEVVEHGHAHLLLGDLIGRVPAQPHTFQATGGEVGQLAEHRVQQIASTTTSVCRNSRAFIAR